MRIAFVLNGLDICGGVYVILQHASCMKSKGECVYLVVPNSSIGKGDNWHPALKEMDMVSIDEAIKMTFDIAIATAWDTVYMLNGINASRYCYFVQAIESQFMASADTVGKLLADNTYTYPFNYITEATWIKQYLFENYGWDSGLVLNGIRKDLYSGNQKIAERDRFRVLIEGGLYDARKNVALTIELARQSEADEIWLMTSTAVDEVSGVDRVFSQVPADKVPEVYRSCDVLVKLSLAEGMYGPPLEMFHCGGTVITFDIPGSEEYIVDGYNALVAQVGENEKVVTYINELKHNRELLHKLQDGALETAKRWRDWEQSSEEFYEVIRKTVSQTNEEINEIRKGTSYMRSLLEYSRNMPKANKNLFRTEFEKLEQYKLPVIVYGAGKRARDFLSSLMDTDLCVAGIAVNKLDGNPKYLYGHAVKELSEYTLLKEKVVVYVSVKKDENEIVRQLRENGFLYVVES